MRRSSSALASALPDKYLADHSGSAFSWPIRTLAASGEIPKLPDLPLSTNESSPMPLPILENSLSISRVPMAFSIFSSTCSCTPNCRVARLAASMLASNSLPHSDCSHLPFPSRSFAFAGSSGLFASALNWHSTIQPGSGLALARNTQLMELACSQLGKFARITLWYWQLVLFRALWPAQLVIELAPFLGRCIVLGHHHATASLVSA